MVINIISGMVVEKKMVECPTDHFSVFLISLWETSPEAEMFLAKFLKGVVAEFFKLGMQKRLSPHNPRHEGIADHRIDGVLEGIPIHEVRFPVADKTGAVGTFKKAGRTNFYLDRIVVENAANLNRPPSCYPASFNSF